MDEAKLRARRQAALAAEFDIEVPKQVGPSHKTIKEDISREAEAVLSYMRRPLMFIERTCSCGKDFKVNRRDVSCCSDQCRARELAELGMEWDWSRSTGERWAAMKPTTPEPLIVPSEVLDIIHRVLGTSQPIVGATSL